MKCFLKKTSRAIKKYFLGESHHFIYMAMIASKRSLKQSKVTTYHMLLQERGMELGLKRLDTIFQKLFANFKNFFGFFWIFFFSEGGVRNFPIYDVFFREGSLEIRYISI